MDRLPRLGRAARPVGLTAVLAALAFAAGGCGGSDSDRVRFAGEGDRCRDTKALYLDETGDELFCEGYEYKGPLTKDEKRETIRLATRLADDGGLSDGDKDQVREFAENPPELARTHLVPRTIAAVGEKVWVLGQAEDASYHLAGMDRPGSGWETITNLPSLGTGAGLASCGDKLVLFNNTDLVSADGGVPLWQLETTGTQSVEQLIVRTEGSAWINAVACGDDALWIALSLVGDEGTAADMVERFDPGTQRATSTSDLSNDRATRSIRSIEVGEDAVWVEGERLWRVDPKTGKASLARLDAPVGVVRLGAGALWALGGSDPADPRLYRIDPASGKTEASYPVRADIVEIEAGSKDVWMLHVTGELERLDIATGRLDTAASLDIESIAPLATIDGAASRSLAVTDDAAWAILDSSGRVARVDAETEEVSVQELSVEYSLAED